MQGSSWLSCWSVTFCDSLAGVSRSSTIIVAYVMSVTDLDYRSALDAVRGARSCALPNFGFLRQLLNFQRGGLEKVSRRFCTDDSTFYYW